MWAIARARRGAPRVTRYQNVVDDLRSVLESVAVDEVSTNPADSILSLRDTTPWWTIDAPDITHTGQFASGNPSIGLSVGANQLIVSEPGFAHRAVDIINQRVDHYPQHGPDLARLLNDLGLAGSDLSPHQRSRNR